MTVIVKSWSQSVREPYSTESPWVVSYRSSDLVKTYNNETG